MSYLPALTDPHIVINWNSGVGIHHDGLTIPRQHTNLNLENTIEIVPAYDPGLINTVTLEELESRLPIAVCAPLNGRFLPSAWFRSSVATSKFPYPFVRVIKEKQQWVLDGNHPLSAFEIHGIMMRGGDINSLLRHEIIETTKTGPGMQAPWNQSQAANYIDYPFSRNDETPDNHFYAQPRFVHHIDDKAIQLTRNFYSDILPVNSYVLDLMSSWVSHIKPSRSDLTVTGLGMNRDELKANGRLKNFIVQDLNIYPSLPFSDAQFDAVICTVSIEYLRRPLEIFREVARVLTERGLFVNILSERCFPTKTITIWNQLYPFERLGLILDFYRHSNQFIEIETFSVRELALDNASNRDPWYAIVARKQNI